MAWVSLWIPNLRVFGTSVRFDQQHIESTFLRELQNPPEPPPFIVDPGGQFSAHQDRLVAVLVGDIDKPIPLTIQIPIPGLFRREDSRINHAASTESFGLFNHESPNLIDAIATISRRSAFRMDDLDLFPAS